MSFKKLSSFSLKSNQFDGFQLKGPNNIIKIDDIKERIENFKQRVVDIENIINQLDVSKFTDLDQRVSDASSQILALQYCVQFINQFIGRDPDGNNDEGMVDLSRQIDVLGEKISCLEEDVGGLQNEDIRTKKFKNKFNTGLYESLTGQTFWQGADITNVEDMYDLLFNYFCKPATDILWDVKNNWNGITSAVSNYNSLIERVTNLETENLVIKNKLSVLENNQTVDLTGFVRKEEIVVLENRINDLEEENDVLTNSLKLIQNELDNVSTAMERKVDSVVVDPIFNRLGDVETIAANNEMIIDDVAQRVGILEKESSTTDMSNYVTTGQFETIENKLDDVYYRTANYNNGVILSTVDEQVVAVVPLYTAVATNTSMMKWGFANYDKHKSSFENMQWSTHASTKEKLDELHTVITSKYSNIDSVQNQIDRLSDNKLDKMLPPLGNTEFWDSYIGVEEAKKQLNIPFFDGYGCTVGYGTMYDGMDIQKYIISVNRIIKPIIDILYHCTTAINSLEDHTDKPATNFRLNYII